MKPTDQTPPEETDAAKQQTSGGRVPRLVRLAEEFEAWAKATKVDFANIHPRPRIPIYTPQIHPRRDAEWNREWGNWLWPKAAKWWADRGYELKGRDGQWHVEPNATMEARRDGRPPQQQS